MATIKALVNSYGFRDVYHEEGEILKNVSFDEILKMSKTAQIKHFEAIDDEAKKFYAEIDGKDETDIEKLRKKYFDKFGKEVPVNKKNNIDWIITEIE